MDELEALLKDLFCGDDERAEAAANALAQFGKQAVDALAPLITAPEIDVRWWTVRALAGIRDPRVGDLLCAALHDEDLSVRQCAALALSQQPVSSAADDLIGNLGDPDALLRRLAGDALIALGKDAVSGLLTVLESGSQTARLEAVRAIALIGDERTIPALYQAWEEGSTLIKYWAEEGLNCMGEGMTFFKVG